MKFRSVVLLLVAALLIPGCASLQTTKDILEVTINPETGVNAGTILTSTVKTTEDVEKVFAYLKIKQEIKAQYKFDEKKKLWTFAYMIPMTVPLPRAEVTVRIEVIKKNGDRQAVERKIRTY